MFENVGNLGGQDCKKIGVEYTVDESKNWQVILEGKFRHKPKS